MYQISDMVTRYKREEITVWASTNSAIMENCQKTVELPATWGRQSSPCDKAATPLLPELANPALPLLQNGSMPYSFTVKRGLLLLLLFYTGLLPFVPLGESLLQFYLPRIINRCGRCPVSDPDGYCGPAALTVGPRPERDKCACGLFVPKDVHPREAHPEEQTGRPFAGKVSQLHLRLTFPSLSWTDEITHVLLSAG